MRDFTLCCKVVSCNSEAVEELEEATAWAAAELGQDSELSALPVELRWCATWNCKQQDNLAKGAAAEGNPEVVVAENDRPIHPNRPSSSPLTE